MANFVIETFTTKTNKVDLVDAAHINTVQTSIVNIETALNILCTTLGALNQGASFPVSPITGQLFYRTDLTQVYIYTGSAWATVATISNIQFFSGSGTFTAPTGVTKVYVTMVAGGGGGGQGNGGNNAAGGGGGEGIVNVPHTVTPGSPYTVTVGAGGTGGASSNSTGNNGGTTTFDTISVSGGNGGGFGAAPAATTGGGGTLDGVTTTPGSYGFKGGGASGGSCGSGAGGASIFGPGGASASNAAANTGAGGGGNVGGTGGNGAAGFVMVAY